MLQQKSREILEFSQNSIKKISSKFGPLQILVNNAARDDRHSLQSVTSEYFDERIATNLKHQLFASQAVVSDMEKNGGGAIINMGSTSWMIGQGGMPCYTTAKSAIQGLTRGLARDLGPKNIRVNCVVPGWIMTERQVDMWLTPESEKELMDRQCIKRKLFPKDIARFVLFKVSSPMFTSKLNNLLSVGVIFFAVRQTPLQEIEDPSLHLLKSRFVDIL